MTVWALFEKNSKYFEPSRAPFMLNYRVDDLDALLEALRAEGVEIDPKRENYDYGRFAATRLIVSSSDPRARPVYRPWSAAAWAREQASSACGGAGFEPGVFIDNAMRLVFASALSTCTFTIWPTLTTSLGSLM